MYRRIAGFLVALIAVGCVGALPAEAGGPTSVLLSAPPKLVAVGYEDQRYADLQKLTGIESLDKPGGERHDVGSFVRATWLIHDMTPWRLDIIYPDAPGGPWIATEEFNGDTKPDKPTWHRSTASVKLLQLLGSLKLLDGTFEGGPTLSDGYQAPAEETRTQEPAAPAPAQTQVTTSPTFFTGWRWIIPGVLLGAAIAVVAVRLFPRRQWDLID